MVRKTEKGFTLIELMVVIVILGALVALVGPNVWNALVGSTKRTVELQMDSFKKAVQMYYLDKRQLPSSLQELTSPDSSGEPFLESVPPDPWGSEYDYRVVNATKREYTITSSGEDKASGTADDLVWSSLEGMRK